MILTPLYSLLNGYYSKSFTLKRNNNSSNKNDNSIKFSLSYSTQDTNLINNLEMLTLFNHKTHDCFSSQKIKRFLSFTKIIWKNIYSAALSLHAATKYLT